MWCCSYRNGTERSVTLPISYYYYFYFIRITNDKRWGTSRSENQVKIRYSFLFPSPRRPFKRILKDQLENCKWKISILQIFVAVLFASFRFRLICSKDLLVSSGTCVAYILFEVKAKFFILAFFAKFLRKEGVGRERILGITLMLLLLLLLVLCGALVCFCFAFMQTTQF